MSVSVSGRSPRSRRAHTRGRAWSARAGDRCPPATRCDAADIQPHTWAGKALALPRANEPLGVPQVCLSGPPSPRPPLRLRVRTAGCTITLCAPPPGTELVAPVFAASRGGAVVRGYGVQPAARVRGRAWAIPYIHVPNHQGPRVRGSAVVPRARRSAVDRTRPLQQYEQVVYQDLVLLTNKWHDPRSRRAVE